MKINKFDTLESTNKHCEALDLEMVEDFTCFWALEQTDGIGQRGNHWESAPGENLTFSLVLKPTFLAAERQFRLTQALSLAVTDFLKAFPLPYPVHIKWPNDIYVGQEKICGMLTNNRLQGNHICASICGIGININQHTFPDWIPNPTSIAILTGKQYPLDQLLQQLLECIAKRYDELRKQHDPNQEYLNRLMNLGTPAKYLYQGREITATITGVNSFGHLLLDTKEGEQLCCEMKEIQYVTNKSNPQ
jgi:BirA family biotin operon repressor/biotin-[acetyl-CoA-carboxylase] ligase